MSQDVHTSFLTYYLRSLKERTRSEVSGDKYGFDWVIYNLALSLGWIPKRLPFLRTGANDISTTKTENEFGIDFSFLSPDREDLFIFVLKDEVLNSKNWTKHSFDFDLRKAAQPDLKSSELESVKRVIVTLAYNKDEDAAGIKLFDDLVGNLPTKLRNDVDLKFERWNLTELVERVKSSALTPSLLPQKFFSLFTYVCAQFSDLRHGSDEWESNVVRTWRHFLAEVLKEKCDERSLRLLPVALIILKEHGKTNETFETGWIDLAEWAMLAVWNSTQDGSKRLQEVAFEMWTKFYVVELDRFYQAHSKELSTEHFFDIRSGSYLEAVAGSMAAFWHLARLGILGLTYQQLLPHVTDEERRMRAEVTNDITNRMVAMLNSNPACVRPILDIHHIQLFLVWRCLWQNRRQSDIYKWLAALQQGLYIRRSGHNPLPFIEGYNRLERVWEVLLDKEKPYDFCDKSSYLILMLLEFCCSLPEAEGDELLSVFYRNIVLSVDKDGQPINENRPLDLLGWHPPEDWASKIARESLAQEGESLTFLMEEQEQPSGPQIRKRLSEFVAKTRAERTFDFPENWPVAVIVLACLKHDSPLPMELWRRSIFPLRNEKTPQEVV